MEKISATKLTVGGAPILIVTLKKKSHLKQEKCENTPLFIIKFRDPEISLTIPADKNIHEEVREWDKRIIEAPNKVE